MIPPSYTFKYYKEIIGSKKDQQYQTMWEEKEGNVVKPDLVQSVLKLLLTEWWLQR